MTSPTAEEADQCTVAHHEIVETLNRLAREGFDPRILLAASSSASADLVTTFFGVDQVPAWFAAQAIAARAMIEDAS